MNRVAHVVTLALVGSLGAAAPAAAQTGFVNLPYTVEGMDRTAALWVPPAYDASRDWPLIVSLHGGGEQGDNNGDAITGDWGRESRLHFSEQPFFVLFPRAPANHRWGRKWSPPPGLPDALREGLRRAGGIENAASHIDAAIEAVHHGYSTDRDRVTLMGCSRGGSGALEYGAQHPDRVAAVVSVAAPVHPEDVATLATIPVWMFYGTLDQIHPVSRFRKDVQAIKDAGGSIRYTEYEGVDHPGTCQHDKPELMEWLLSQRRSAR